MDHLKTQKPVKENRETFNYMNEETKVVISFDGGGMRGLISVIIAEALEKAAGFQLAETCDLMIGTSTGGINALLFTAPDINNPNLCRFNANDLIQEYKQFGKKIFATSFSQSLKSLWGLERCKYSDAGIKEVTIESFENVRLKQALTRVVVVGAEIERYIPLLLKSYEGPDILMRDAAIATSAAPTYFPVAKFKPLTRHMDTYLFNEKSEDYYIIDGKLTGLNNPASMGYAEICDIFQDIKDIKEKVIVISIGTGKAHRTIHYDEVLDGGALVWLPFLLPLISELANDVTDYQMNILLKDLPQHGGASFRRYWRFQPTIPEEYLLFDKFTDQKIKDIINAVKNYVLDHEREIRELGQILSRRAQYLKEERAKRS